MKYKLHPHVLLERVAGQYLLIAYGEISDGLPLVTAINDTGAYFWGMLEQELGWEEMLIKASEEYDSTSVEIEAGLKVFIRELENYGYINVEQ